MMKKIIFHSLLVLVATAAFQACQTDSLMLYEQSPSIYFQKSSFRSGVAYDSTSISFAFLSGTVQDTLLSIYLNTTGKLADYDREVAVVVDEDSTTMVKDLHYQIISAYVPANSTVGHVRVRVFRTPDLESGEQVLRLRLKLAPNNEFNLDFMNERSDYGVGVWRDKLSYHIYISDVWIRPASWTFSEPYYGTFSVKKFKLICEVCDVPPALLNMQEVDGRLLSTGEPPIFANMVKLHLEYMKAEGTPVLEEDGTEMTMGPSVY